MICLAVEGSLLDAYSHGWFTVLCNGTPVWHAPEHVAKRYAADPDFRKNLERRKLHEQPPTRSR